MKRNIPALVLAFILFLGMTMERMPGYARGDADERNPSIDVVIVLDQSRSMRGNVNSTQNDPKDYRLDAAQMLISMCDMNSSRVALVPFSGDIENYGDDDFVAINDVATRRDKMSKIDALRGNTLRPDTDLGNALGKAVKMILERKDKRNSPMIIILSDGENSIQPITGTDKYNDRNVYQWNAATKAFEITNIKNYTSANADALRNKAVEVAASNGIPIYTIPLLSASSADKQSEQKMLEDMLRAIADTTGGSCTPINASNADQLPRIFGEVLASKLGSTLIENLTPTLVEGSTVRYEVKLPILNQSVLEANIYIPTTGIQVNSISLYDASGKNVTQGGPDVCYFPSSNFVLYKICSPRTMGDWRLVFDLKDAKASARDISFSLMYNYNITLKSMVGKDGYNMVSGANGITLSKTETLYVTSSFYNTSDDPLVDGSPSTDQYLYQVQDGPEWKTIKGTYTLLDAYGNRVGSPKNMVSDGIKQFSAQIDLTSLSIDGDGYNTLKAGNYELLIVTEGAGLHRENRIPVTITNVAPVLNANSLGTVVTVNDPDKPETNAVQTIEVLLSGMIVDPDNGKLRFELLPVGDAASIINMSIVQRSDGATVARGETLWDGVQNAFKYGDAQYKLIATDIDGASLTTDFVVNVRSKRHELVADFNCITTTAGIDGNGIAQKNDAVTFRMELKRKDNGAADTTGAISAYTGTVFIYNAANTSGYIDKLNMALDTSGTYLTATYTTGNKSADLVAKCEFVLQNTVAGTAEFPFFIENHDPQVVASVRNKIPTTITYDPLPGFLSFLDAPTDVKQLVIDSAALFMDTDNEAGLELSNPKFTSGDRAVNSASILSFTQDGTKITLQPLSSGKVTLSLTATDGDGRTAEAVVNITVVSLMEKWQALGLTALIALLALILVILLIRQALKPVFKNGMVLEIRVGSSLYAAQTSELLPTKKPQLLSNFVDSALSQQNDIPFEVLSKIKLFPMRSVSGDIKAVQAKPMAGYEIRINDVPISKKRQVWHADHSMVLRALHSSSVLTVTLTTTADTFTSVGSSGFTDSFNADFMGTSGFSGDFQSQPQTKASLKNNKHDSPDIFGSDNTSF